MSKSETQISKEKAGALASRSKSVLKTLDFEPSFIDVISWIVRAGRPVFCCKSQRSRRLKIAHRFIGGIRKRRESKSVKRTAEVLKVVRFIVYQSSAFRGLSRISAVFPALKRWAIFISSA